MNDVQLERDSSWAKTLKIPYIYTNAKLSDIGNLKVKAMLHDWLANLSGDEDVPVIGPNLLIDGPTGTGKTHAVYCLSRELWVNGVEDVYGLTTSRHLVLVSEPELVASVGSFDNNNLVVEYNNVPVLCIDDIGKSKQHWATEVIWRIVNSRLEHGRPTVYTTNLDTNDLIASRGETIVSRIKSSKHRIKLVGEDHRLAG